MTGLECPCRKGLGHVRCFETPNIDLTKLLINGDDTHAAMSGMTL